MSCWLDGNPLTAKLLVVGMAPGAEELAQDRPFVGPSGRLLWSMLKKAGIDRSDCYILNIIQEWPAGKTGAPTPEQLDRFWDAFDIACAAFLGKFALVLGGDAIERFTGLSGGVKAWGGYLVHSDERQMLTRQRRVETVYKTNGKNHKKGDPRIAKVKEEVPPPPFDGLILPALHPAGVLRSGLATAPILASQCRRVGRATRGELKPVRTQYVTYPVLWAQPKEVAVDIETGGIDGGVIRLGCATDFDAWSAHWSQSTRGVAQSLLGRETTVYLLHNAGFDLPRLAAAGARVAGPIRDTMLAAAMLQPDLPKGLNAAASLYLDSPRWKHLDEEDPAKYNALDAIRTYELWQQERALLTETGQLGLFENTIMKALPTIINMGTRGIRIDLQRRDEWLVELRERGSRLLAEWNAKTGSVDYDSAPQLKQYFRSINVEIPYNKDGAETTDKQGLARLKTDYPELAPLLDLLVQVRSVFKDIATYAEVSVGSDGRVHPNFTPAWKDEDETGKGLSGTWRITSNSPNLQNQHQRARRMYVPSEGMCFVGADYAQLEARILAWLAGDRVLLEDCEHDLHARNAERLGVDETRAKNGFYGWSYLAGPKTLQNTFAGRGFKVTQDECAALLAGFDATYSRAASFRREALAIMQAQRYVQNPFGLRRYFPHKTFPAPAAMSTLIQSTGAIMMWKILPELEAVLEHFGGRLLLSVHDDILGECPLEHSVACLGAIRDIMVHVFPEVAPGFTVPCSLKTSLDSWGEMKEVACAADITG